MQHRSRQELQIFPLFQAIRRERKDGEREIQSGIERKREKVKGRERK